MMRARPTSAARAARGASVARARLLCGTGRLRARSTHAAQAPLGELRAATAPRTPQAAVPRFPKKSRTAQTSAQRALAFRAHAFIQPPVAMQLGARRGCRRTDLGGLVALGQQDVLGLQVVVHLRAQAHGLRCPAWRVKRAGKGPGQVTPALVGGRLPWSANRPWQRRPVTPRRQRKVSLATDWQRRLRRGGSACGRRRVRAAGARRRAPRARSVESAGRARCRARRCGRAATSSAGAPRRCPARCSAARCTGRRPARRTGVHQGRAGQLHHTLARDSRAHLKVIELPGRRGA